MWVWASIIPGSTVAWLRSITLAPAGILSCVSGPTSVMRSPCSSTTCFVSIWPVLLSNNWPARTATTCGAGGHLFAAPSDPKHGGGPPRATALRPAAPSCAYRVVASADAPSNPNAADFNPVLHLIA